MTAIGAMDVITELVGRIGPRPAGTDAEQEAARYLLATASQAGASAYSHAFVFRGWRSGGKSTVRLEDEGIELVGDALPYTVATPREGATGTLREIGDWPLIPGRVYCKRFLVEDADDRPLAAIMACPYDDVRSLPNPQPLSAMPTLVVGLGDGKLLGRLVDNGRSGSVSARVEIAAEWEGLLSSQNIVADVGPGETRLLIVSHYDSVPDSPGANDNASGVAVALGLLRRHAAAPNPRYGFRFVFCGAEEPFLVGSRAYAGELAASGELRTIAGCINLDMVGVGHRFIVRAPEDRAWQHAAHALTREAPSGVPVVVHQSIPASDHWSFHEIGLASCQLTRESDAAWHARTDTADRLSEETLDQATTTAEALIGHYMKDGP